MPNDLAREEYDRIAKETADAERVLATADLVYSHIEQDLATAIQLAEQIDEVYRRRCQDASVLQPVLLQSAAD